jgi:hypothetical protein
MIGARVAAVALAGALLAAPRPARAEALPDPVVGGGSFNAAPLLDPGTYRDTLLLGEYLYYAMPLEAGQRLRVGVRVPGVDEETWELAQDAFSINLHTPQRELVGSPVAEDVLGNGNVDPPGVTAANIGERLRWSFYGPRAEPFAAAVEESVYEGPGTWYVSLHSVRVDRRPKVELPVELSIAVDGEPVAEEPDPRPEPERTPAREAARDDGRSPLLLLAVGVVAAAVGVGAGASLGRR